MITVLDKNTSRGTITLVFSDGVELRLSARDVRHQRFSAGVEVTLKERDELVEELEFERADVYLTNRLTQRATSIGQARQALKRKEFKTSVIDKVVAKFTRSGFLDDRLFAEQYVSAALDRRPAGRAHLQAALQKRFIGADLAREVIAEAFAETDEVEVAVAHLRKRWWKLSELELETARQKGYTFLAQRSISYEASKEAFERLVQETADSSGETDR